MHARQGWLMRGFFSGAEKRLHGTLHNIIVGIGIGME
jgi:hypothetical protein